MGTDVISKQTLREIKNSALTGEEMVEFYKEAERSGAGSIEHQLPERIGRDQADALWGWLSQVMGAAAASETGEGHTLEEALEINEGVPAEDAAGAETRPDRRKDFLESGQSGGGSFSFSKEGEATAEEAAEEGGEASEPSAAAEEDRA